nr:unnamed protein product [Spirometra erinaceieuropaei]
MADEYSDLKQMLKQQLRLTEAPTVKLSNSSMGQSSAEPEEDTVIADISTEEDVRRQLSDAIQSIPVNAADIRRATEQNRVLHQAITCV